MASSSSTPSLSAVATSVTVPRRWSSTASSETKLSAWPGTGTSAGGRSGSRSIWRTASQPMKPTRPPVRGGRPGIRGVSQRA
ncbi:hypothetical protein BC477_13130 [Clavibacter michiganensis subsp. michiganensis]|uniref:Uncharacterized protein n=1 Tax=Clavibacter michiganensis subsp. michiganensis TaxID=33013 RepID=A0A251XIA1_CLAMM|nr:hypothetical protein BC477_13130 [Clavibacter michiganensis subsp. michiganensis]OUE02739.1 hypothetical protein CMMCAS07_12035 [Clavibacter michiganensis subsp. michiganensis]